MGNPSSGDKYGPSSSFSDSNPLNKLGKRIGRLLPRSVRGTLILLLLVAFVPREAFEAVHYITMLQDRRSHEFQANLELARSVASAFDTYVQDILRHELSTGLQIAAEQPLSQEQLQRLLVASESDFAALRFLSWVDPQGRVIASSNNEPQGVDLGGLPDLRQVIEGREWAIGDLFEERAGGRPIFTIARRITNDRGVLQGVVVAAFDPQRLDEVIKVERRGEAAVVLIDSRGWGVYRYPEMDMPWEQRGWIKVIPIIGKALAGEEITDTIVTLMGGEKRMAAYTPIGSIGWVASASRSEQEVMAPVFQELLRESGLDFGVVVVAFLVALLISRNVTGPLSRLREYAEAFGRGDVRHKMEAAGLRELVELANAFARMSEEIRTKQEQLQDVNQRLIDDIDERKLGAAALRESNQTLETLIEASPAAIIALDRNENVTMWNSAAERIFGWSEQEVMGRPNPIVPEDKMEQFRAIQQRLLQGENLSGLELRRRRKDGSLIDISMSTSFLRDDNGEMGGSVAIITDITQRKLVEEELRRSRDELERRVGERTMELTRVNEELRIALDEHEKAEEQIARAQRLEMAGRVAGQVAHDFNNLLTPFMAYPELIKAGLPEGHPASRLCDSMLRSAQQMADINEDLLTLSRRGHFNQEPTDLNRLLQQAIAQMPARPATLAIELDLAADLLPIRASEAQLLRVTANLLSNAREAMQDDGLLRAKSENVYVDKPFGRYNRVEKGEYVKFQLSDTGCGISEEIRHRIFDPFFTTKRTDRQRGSGLGLSVVQVIVEDHGGYLDVESEVGKGSTFSVYFPVFRGEMREEANKEVRSGSEAILIVDDDELQREVISRLLEGQGYRVAVASGGEEALAFLKEHTVDLLIMDMVMPGGPDGAQTYDQVLRIRPGQRAIILSGYAESDRVQEMQAMGAGAFLRKPVTLWKLAQAVREELERKV